MIAILAFVLLLFAMFGFFAYVAWKDPAGIFKPKRRPPEDGNEPPAG